MGCAIEVGDEGLIGLLAQELLRVLRGDGLIAEAMRGHGGAGVDENAGADGEVLLELEVEDLGGRDAVVEEGEVGEAEVVDGEAVCVGCVEGEDDFVDGDVEAIGRVCLCEGELCEGERCERESEDDESGDARMGRSHRWVSIHCRTDGDADW